MTDIPYPEAPAEAETEATAGAPRFTDQWDPNPAPVEWLVQDWLPIGTVTVLIGKSGSGKTQLALRLATAIASYDAQFDSPSRHPLVYDGWPLGWLQTEHPETVAYSAYDTPQQVLNRRLVHELKEGDLGAVGQRLLFASIGTESEGLMWEGEYWVNNQYQLFEEARERDARLLILDGAHKACRRNPQLGTSTVDSEVRTFLAELTQEAQKGRMAVLCICTSGEFERYRDTPWWDHTTALWRMAPIPTQNRMHTPWQVMREKMLYPAHQKPAPDRRRDPYICNVDEFNRNTQCFYQTAHGVIRPDLGDDDSVQRA